MWELHSVYYLLYVVSCVDERRNLHSLLEDVIARLERLEKLIEEERLAMEALAITVKLLRASSSAVDIAESARRLARARILSSQVSDGISRAVMEVLALKGPLNISALTYELRKYRGRASRRIVSARVKRLAEKGLVKVEIRGREKVVDLPAPR